MTGVAGFQAGIEGMIGYCTPGGVPEMLYMTVYAGNSLLIVGCIRESQVMFFVAVNAQLGYFITCWCGIARSRRSFQRRTVRIVAGGTIHAKLRMFTRFPILHAEACITVAAYT